MLPPTNKGKVIYIYSYKAAQNKDSENTSQRQHKLKIKSGHACKLYFSVNDMVFCGNVKNNIKQWW